MRVAWGDCCGQQYMNAVVSSMNAVVSSMIFVLLYLLRTFIISFFIFAIVWFSTFSIPPAHILSIPYITRLKSKYLNFIVSLHVRQFLYSYTKGICHLHTFSISLAFCDKQQYFDQFYNGVPPFFTR